MPTPSKDTTVYAAPVMRKLTEIVSELPPSLRKVADFILRHPLKAATLTIEEMAHETLTSPAAVNRLAKALDLGGYSGMKAELVATLQQMVSPVDKLRNELAHRPGGAFGLHEQLVWIAARDHQFHIWHRRQMPANDTTEVSVATDHHHPEHHSTLP
jgi:hypothetical protein